MFLLIRPRAHQWWCCAVQSYNVGTADASPIWAVRTLRFSLPSVFCLPSTGSSSLVVAPSSSAYPQLLNRSVSLLLPSFLHTLAHPRRRWLDHSCTLPLVFQASTKMAHFLLSPHHRAGRRIELWGLRRAWPCTCSVLVRHIHALKTRGTFSAAFPHIRHLTSVLLLVFVL